MRICELQLQHLDMDIVEYLPASLSQIYNMSAVASDSTVERQEKIVLRNQVDISAGQRLCG